MDLDGGTIITLLVLAVGVFGSVMDSRKRKRQTVLQRQHPDGEFPDLAETTVAVREETSTAAGPTRVSVTAGVSENSAPAAVPGRSDSGKLHIDKRKLVIYSEIMRPKFDEH